MILAVDKPLGMSSHDVINILRQKTGLKRIGHAGTLDPLATGVLVVGFGREATKKLGEIVGKEKTYEATIKFGMTSTTDDEEGEKTIIENISPVSIDNIKDALPLFTGEISQTPPAYSAIKINGQRAYKLARKGAGVKMKSRKVLINDIKIIDYEWPVLKLEIICGPGVYIRSIARDLGKNLGVSGYLTALKRTKVGEYDLANAVKI